MIKHKKLTTLNSELSTLNSIVMIINALQRVLLYYKRGIKKTDAQSR